MTKQEFLKQIGMLGHLFDDSGIISTNKKIESLVTLVYELTKHIDSDYAYDLLSHEERDEIEAFCSRVCLKISFLRFVEKF